KKLAGILTELHIDSIGCCQVVIGIGLNVQLNSETKALINQDVTDCHSLCSEKLDRNFLVAEIISQQIQMLEQFSTRGFAPFAKQWQAHDLLNGKAIAIDLGAQQFLGVAQGIDSDGGLKVQSPLGERIFHAGEV